MIWEIPFNYRRIINVIIPSARLPLPFFGFTGTDGQGLAGLEAYYDEYLSGTAGRLVTAKNAVGTDMPFQYEQK